MDHLIHVDEVDPSRQQQEIPPAINYLHLKEICVIKPSIHRNLNHMIAISTQWWNKTKRNKTVGPSVLYDSASRKQKQPMSGEK